MEAAIADAKSLVSLPAMRRSTRDSWFASLQGTRRLRAHPYTEPYEPARPPRDGTRIRSADGVFAECAGGWFRMLGVLDVDDDVT